MNIREILNALADIEKSNETIKVCEETNGSENKYYAFPESCPVPVGKPNRKLVRSWRDDSGWLFEACLDGWAIHTVTKHGGSGRCIAAKYYTEDTADYENWVEKVQSEFPDTPIDVAEIFSHWEG